MSKTNNVGHNSVQIPHDGKIDEATWRKAESNMLRRERIHLVRKGVITPIGRMPPQMLVKDDAGRWCPEIKIN